MIKIITGLISILGRAISQQTATLGFTDGKLAPCPNSPNCVSSQSSDKVHWITSGLLLSNGITYMRNLPLQCFVLSMTWSSTLMMPIRLFI